MITRPLELASHLRPVPRNFDTLFYVNVGLIAFFFVLFGSAFVIGPGVAVKFQLPQVVSAERNRTPFTHYITVTNAGHILTDRGQLDMPGLQKWLREKAAEVRKPSLQVRAETDVSWFVVLAIFDEATAAGFDDVQTAANKPSSLGRATAK